MSELRAQISDLLSRRLDQERHSDRLQTIAWIPKIPLGATLSPVQTARERSWRGVRQKQNTRKNTLLCVLQHGVARLHGGIEEITLRLARNHAF
jgi:hypothetical protein